jgi:hypothetical protein
MVAACRWFEKVAVAYGDGEVGEDGGGGDDGGSAYLSRIRRSTVSATMLEMAWAEMPDDPDASDSVSDPALLPPPPPEPWLPWVSDECTRSSTVRRRCSLVGGIARSAAGGSGSGGDSLLHGVAPGVIGEVVAVLLPLVSNPNPSNSSSSSSLLSVTTGGAEVGCRGLPP